MHRRTQLRLAFALTLAAGAGCASEAPTSGISTSIVPGSSSTLLVCPSSTTLSTTSIIGSLGGVLSVDGTSVTIPANAVLAPTSFTLTVPASRYVEIEVTAGDADHFLFSQPVQVAVDYSRCGGGWLLSSPHQAWNIDPNTKALLENMGGVDEKLTRTVVFSTLHFSGYALVD
jgi:hypothetical protein